MRLHGLKPKLGGFHELDLLFGLGDVNSFQFLSQIG